VLCLREECPTVKSWRLEHLGGVASRQDGRKKRRVIGRRVDFSAKGAVCRRWVLIEWKQLCGLASFRPFGSPWFGARFTSTRTPAEVQRLRAWKRGWSIRGTAA